MGPLGSGLRASVSFQILSRRRVICSGVFRIESMVLALHIIIAETTIFWPHYTRGSAGQLALTVLEGIMEGLRHQGKTVDTRH